MRKFFTLVAFTAISFFAHSQVLVGFDFYGRTGNQATDVSTQNAVGVLPSIISRGNGLSATIMTNSFSSIGFSSTLEASIAGNDYIEFTVSPAIGYQISITSVSFFGTRTTPNTGGPRTFVLRTSLDNYSTNVSGPSTQIAQNNQSVAVELDLNQIIISPTPVTFRIYGYDAQSTSGRLSLGTNTIGNLDLVVEGPAPTILPVNFISFDAISENNGAKLTWKVADQVDVLRYDVERSSNGNNFTKIGEVAAADVTTYTFTDNQPAQSTVYYRVKNVDVDGKFKYSTIVSIRNGNAAIVLKAFPTPAKNNVTLQHGTANAKTTIRISAQDGRQVAALRPAAGSMQTGIDLSAYAPGLYLISFDNGNGQVETLKVVKQ